MATSGQEVELLDKGTITVTPTRGPFALNMIYRHEAWEVRRGFGQVAQYDTTMSLNPPVRGGVATDWGYRKHLGSKLIHTSFGHDQILSVFHAFNMTTNNLDAARQLDLYMVSIYDLTTDTRWEEPLYRHTSELDAGNEDADSWHGHYETDLDTDNQKWVAGRGDEYFYFVDTAVNADTDVLFFGSSHTGVWAYVPSIFRHANRKFLDSTNQHEWTRPYGESSLVRPLGTVVPTTLSGESFQYFRPDEVDRVNVIGKLGKRLVYGLDHILLFSDDDAPAQIVTDNFLTIPSDYPITAMADYNGQLLIWTTNETFVYSPSSGDLVVGGRLMKISDTVGCVGPNAWSRVDDMLFFVDSQGAYTYDGRLGVKLVSGDIDKFFTDFITNPLTSYFTYNGYTQMGTEQPHTTMSFHPTGVNVSYSAHLRALLITVPDQNLTLCLSGSKWSVWSYTSSVYVATISATESSYPGIVQDTDNPAGFVTAPWLLSAQDDLFMVGSVDKQEFTDTVQITDNFMPLTPVDVGDNVKAASHYILRYGRGGAIDRSVREEDDRRIAGKYVTQQYPPAGVNTVRFYVDPWLPVPKAFVFPNGYVVTDYEEVWLCPLALVVPVSMVASSNEIIAYKIHIRFDNTEWKPIVAAASQSSETKVDFLLPSERIASAFAYFDPTSTPNGSMDTDHEVRIYNSGTGALDNSGDEMHIAWGGTGQTPASAHGWYHAPSMNLNADRRTILLFIPMRRTGVTTEVSGMALFAPDTTVDGHDLPWIQNSASPSGDFADTAGFIPWEQWTTTSPREEDSVAQPVDWAYKSGRIGDGSNGLKARGAWTRLLSHGKGMAEDYVAQGPNVDWLYGMYNIAVASEGKGWMMQVVDATATTPGYEESISEGTIRTRVLDSSALSDNVFGDTRSKWGTTIFASGDQGTTLIVDEEVNEMATSLSVKGRHFTYMFFGFMQNRAQRLILESSKAVIRALGGRRRRGR